MGKHVEVGIMTDHHDYTKLERSELELLVAALINQQDQYAEAKDNAVEMQELDLLHPEDIQPEWFETKSDEIDVLFDKLGYTVREDGLRWLK
jgi:hypothetical protein